MWHETEKFRAVLEPGLGRVLQQGMEVGTECQGQRGTGRMRGWELPKSSGAYVSDGRLADLAPVTWPRQNVGLPVLGKHFVTYLKGPVGSRAAWKLRF